MGEDIINNIPVLSVVVSTYNGEQYIEECLLSLTKQNLDNKKFEVLIINNNSTDSTQEICSKYVAKYYNFKLFNEIEQGSSSARNRGIKEAKGKYIAFIDDDAKATSTWCENILTAFTTIKPKPVVVGGKILPYYKTKPTSWFNDDIEIRSWGDRKKFLKNGNRYFSGSNMSFQKSILNLFNGFSTEYGVKGNIFIPGEDVELIGRIYKKYPYLFYDPSIIVYHLVKEKKMKIRNRFLRVKNSCKKRYQITPQKKRLKLFFRYNLLMIYYLLKSFISIIPKGINYKTIKYLTLSYSKLVYIHYYIKKLFQR